MDLLRAAVPTLPEFASLSLVLRPEVYSDPSVPMAEPLLVAAPLASVPEPLARKALAELHAYLTATLGRTEESGILSDSRVLAEAFKDDYKTVDELQTFRPLATYGLGLTFRFWRTGTADAALLQKLAAVQLAALQAASSSSSSSSSSTAPTTNPAATLKVEEDLLGIVLCVGMSGLPAASVTSLVQYQIGERLQSCRDVLHVMGPQSLEVPAVKTLLTNLLLHENDYRFTNTRAAAVHVTSIPEIDESAEKAKGLLGRRKDAAKAAAAAAASHPDAPEKEPVVLPLALSSAEMARGMAEDMKVLSVAETDTLLRKYTTPGTERKAQLDLAGGSTTKSSRFNNRKRSSGRDADLDHFDYKGPLRQDSAPAAAYGNPTRMSSNSPLPQGSAPVSRKEMGASKRAAVVAGKNEGRRGEGTHAAASPTLDAAMEKNRPKERRRGREQFADDDATEMSQARLQVNIALNEDLSCSYRSSQLSSCTVEGVVQVQVKAGGRKAAPFSLLLRDPAQHVESFVQNKKFANDASDSLLRDEDADRKFTISVPKDDTYFPVVRYKCTEDLRPVPMRVQTRVKLDDTYCRVALQISSNPNNEAKLVDLTIIMGVPEDIIGESLATQPAGGVWNSGKRCVTWCVEELGEGEKFQLQARFQMTKDARYAPNGEKPQFPVLVRCQCLFAQLSDVELEVRDIPEIAPADITMKIARRFRLSHRERS